MMGRLGLRGGDGAMSRLRVRIDLGPRASIGPGKVRLLELVAETGSIAGAARGMEMSYRRAWLLVDDINRMFRQPVVAASTGGKQGGGARLTDFGTDLVKQFRAIEAEAEAAATARLDRLVEALAPADPG
jgi:molybdate transport system regulatory protein